MKWCIPSRVHPPTLDNFSPAELAFHSGVVCSSAELMFIPIGVVLPYSGNLSFPQQSLNLFKASIPTEYPLPQITPFIPKQNPEYSRLSPVVHFLKPIPFGNQPSLVSPLIPSRVWYILMSHRFPSRVWCLLSYRSPQRNLVRSYTPLLPSCVARPRTSFHSAPQQVVQLYL